MPRLSSTAARTFLRRILGWFMPCAMFAGCQRAAPLPPPTVGDLQFPVAVIFASASVVTFKDAADLGTMRMGNITSVTRPPPLIDSRFAIYRLAKLASTHNGLWLMTHPTSGTPVTFVLERAPESGIEAGRALLRAQLDVQTWRHDLPEARRELAAQHTLADMLAIVQIPE